MAIPKIIASPHATALSGELKTISSSRIKAHTATTPAKVTNRLARSFMASPSVPPYFSILLFIFCNSGCVNPERNKASSVTFISSRPLSPRSVFSIADCAKNHTDELYSIPAETVSLILENYRFPKKCLKNDIEPPQCPQRNTPNPESIVITFYLRHQVEALPVQQKFRYG